MPRITPLTAKSQLAPEHHAVADAVVKVFGQIGGPFSMLLHSPKLAERVLPLVSFFREITIVEPKLRSVAILTAARERESEYVWAAQVVQARRNGVSDQVIDLIRSKSDPAKFSADERAIVTYTRQLIRTNRVDQASFDALKNVHGAQWMVELTAAMHFYVFVSGIANAFEVPAPAGGDKLSS